MRKAFDPVKLAQLRRLPAEAALRRISLNIKADSDYFPIKDPASRRWHVFTDCGDFEILTTGPKWYDTRARRGGGGAIDLAMHVLGLAFIDAVQRLIPESSEHGPDHS
jgi:hypothetical protein